MKRKIMIAIAILGILIFIPTVARIGWAIALDLVFLYIVCGIYYAFKDAKQYPDDEDGS